MNDKRTKKIPTKKAEVIQLYKAILNQKRRTSQEVLYGCTAINSKSYNIEPIVYIKKTRNNIEIKELNGRTKEKIASSQLIQIAD